MGIYTSERVAQEQLLEVSKYCLMAAMKSPQTTGKVTVKGIILTGEDTLPVIEAMEAQAEAEEGPYLSFGDGKTLRLYYDQGDPAAIIIFGATSNPFRSELNWNCNACGFKTCAEFNRFSREIERGVKEGKPVNLRAKYPGWPEALPPGARQTGPTCVWKVLDYGAACGWMAAAASHFNVENRLQGTTGGAARNVGFLPDVYQPVALIVGPCRDQVYYSRPIMKHAYTEEDFRDFAMRALPQLWDTFPGMGDPVFKHSDTWQLEPKYLRWVEHKPTPELVEKRKRSQEKIMGIRARVAARLKEWKEREVVMKLEAKGPPLVEEAESVPERKRVEAMLAEELATPAGQEIKE
ncbi:MAG: hypothetical protein HYU86_11980 [Chloroflexi bacterium]|nr:hypothetical protein [Chloroflexota bacterium]